MASTTIIPFSTLPACATNCYHLYDANGGCVPPAVTTAPLQQYGQCFCSNSLVTPFSTGTVGVCDTACTAETETDGLFSIRQWYTSFCSSVNNEAVATTTGTTTGTGTATSTAKATHKAGSGGNNSWLNNHWRWVVFIVVVVVAIIAIWVGACFWHRRYLRRKDRQFALENMRAAADATPGPGLGFDTPASQHDAPPQSSMRNSVIVSSTGGAAGIPGAPPSSAPSITVPPGTATTYDASTEKRRSNVLVGRRRN